MAPPHHMSRLPYTITEASPVLASHIPLPPHPSIAYTKFIPVQQQEQQHKAVELARQCIVNSVRRSGKSSLESLLPIVSIGKDEVVLWVFLVCSQREHTAGGKGKQKELIPAAKELEALAFDGLQRFEISNFTPSSLYPCSSACAKLSSPCTSCTRAPSISSTAGGETHTSLSSTTLFPRYPLRTVYSLFIDAVRDRLIDEICTAAPRTPEGRGNTHFKSSKHMSGATRLGHGFLSSRDHSLPMWGCGWERRSCNRPLVHTAIDVYLSPTAIHIRPLPTLTRLLPMPIWYSPSSPTHPPHTPLSTTFNSPPLCPGTPIILAPYPTPAFYVSTHAGSSVSNSLRGQFWDALSGLGVPTTWSHPRLLSTSPFKSSANLCASSMPMEPFILAFIPLLNPQGEPKGVTALWPARLAFIDTSPTRFQLSNLPEMPGTEALLTPPRGSGTQQTAQTASPISNPPLIRPRTSLRGSVEQLNRAQRTFRALELSSHKRVPGLPIHGTAKSTAGYVENVAREREKEREKANQERMRRERELKEGRSSSTAQATPNSTSSVTQVSQTLGNPTGSDPASPKVSLDSPRPGFSWHSVPTNFFTRAAQDTVVHSFYPSPPDWNPGSSTHNTGISDSSSGENAAAASTPSTLEPRLQSGANVVQEASSREALALSNSIDLGMDIDMDDMSMGINLGNTMGMLDVNMGVNVGAASLMDGGFGSFSDAFTDDDFNYFDAAPIPEPLPVATPDIQPPLHHLRTDDGAVNGWLANGLTETDQDGNVMTSSQLRQVIPASVGVDASRNSLQSLNGFTMSEDDRDLLPPAPDLIPSSPAAKSPWSPGNPPTPSLELDVQPVSPTGKQLFEPIYFGNRHYVADGKYRDAMGKFAFSNTLSRISPLSYYSGSPDESNTEKENGWKLRYAAVTDPRIGVINRLRGIKRKMDGNTHSSKLIDGRSRDEEWESIYDQPDDDELDSPSSSEEEEDDAEDLELEQDRIDDSSSQSHPSRPSTPSPSGLPLTATLLYFQLHHSHLLPLGVPMHPSYEDLVSGGDPPPAPISVPTPVSPAAALGSTAERNKTLEILAQAVAKEAVENHVWSQAWGSSFDGISTQPSSRTRHDVPQTDLEYIADLMGRVTGLIGPLSLSNLLGSSSPTVTASAPHTANDGSGLQMLHLPRLSIGRAGLIHQMLPSAIRFWEKQGLGPRGGAKDVVAFAMFEDGDERSSLVEAWMERVGRTYTARGFGIHTPGNAGTFGHGLIPLQFEAVRKTLPQLISALPEEPPHIVIYIIAPTSLYSSLKSPALRAIIMGQKRVSKLGGQHDFDQSRVLFHFVPDFYVADPHTYPATRHVGLEWFVNSVYDRLLRVSLRQTSRLFWECNPPFENRFQVPAFTLARNMPPQIQLEWDESPSLNVLDRHTFLHVGYCLSRCKRWLLAACIDERGEAHDVAVWGIPSQSDSQALHVTWMVSNIWIFVKQFAQRADTEWRIVISKLGEIGECEVEVWMSHLETMVSTHTGPPVHVSLVCAQSDIPLPFLCPANEHNDARVNSLADFGAVFADVSSVTYSAFFAQRTPVISPDLLLPLEHPSLVTPPVLPDEEADASVPTSPPAGVLPLCTSALLRVPNDADYATVEGLYIHLLYSYKSARSTLKKTTQDVHAEITRNWHDLAVLTRERWHFPHRGQLPFHLAALELMSSVLDPDVLTPDSKELDYLGN